MSKSKQIKPAAVQFRALCESAATLDVDDEAGVIRGVKILGRSSVNGRRYTPEAIANAQSLYEGAPVYVNHPKKPGDMRDYNDRGGVLKSTRIVEGELFGDMHTNPQSERGKQLLWEAKNCPRTFGLSHTAHGYGRQDGKVWVCEEIAQVHSVDVVTRPATTKGLFESEGNMDGEDMAGGAAVETPSPTAAVEDSFKAAINAVVEGDGEDAEKLKKIKALLKAKSDAIAAVNGESSTPAEAPADDAETPVAEGVAKTKAPAGAVALSESDQRELHRLRGEKAARGLLEAAGVECKAEFVEAVAALPDARRAPFIATLKGSFAPQAPGRIGVRAPRSAAPLSESADNAPKAPQFTTNADRLHALRG